MRKRVYRRNGHWYLDYEDHKGRRVRRLVAEAIKQSDAHEALARTLHREAMIREGYADTLDNSAGVGDLLEGFLLHKLATRRYETVRFYRAALTDILGRFRTPGGRLWPPQRQTAPETVRAMPRVFEAGALNIQRVEEITPERVEVYVEAHRRDAATRTLNKVVAALKTLLEWARKAGRIRSNPIAEMSRVGKPAVSTRALEVDEAEALLDTSPEPYQTIWLAFLTTGMRAGELTNLQWPQVDFATNSIRILPDTSKSDRQRDVPMAPDLRARLLTLRKSARDPEGHVFTTQAGSPWVNNLRKRFARWVELALVGDVAHEGGQWFAVYREDGHEVREPMPDVRGWKAAKAELRRRRGHRAEGVSLHTLRHTFATQLLLNGENPKVVSELLGHSGIQITLDIYGHVFPRNKQEALARLPFGGGRKVAGRALPGHWREMGSAS